MTVLLVYLLMINVLLFALMGIAKYKARHNQWRIRESTLFACAIIGGSLGGILGMRLFRHKTLHPTFRYGFPAILVLQLAAAVWFAVCQFA